MLRRVAACASANGAQGGRWGKWRAGVLAMGMRMWTWSTTLLDVGGTTARVLAPLCAWESEGRDRAQQGAAGRSRVQQGGC